MSEVVSFRVRREIKRKMELYKDKINWAEELRRFVELKIREIEAKENFKAVLERLEKATWSVPKGFSIHSIREGRDSS